MPADANYYNQGYEFFKKAWENAVVGTPFEGKIQCIQSETLGSTAFGDYLRNGSVDVLFGVGYGGDEFDPYSMIDCFVRDDLAYDAFTDKKSVMVDIELNGQVLRASKTTYFLRGKSATTCFLAKPALLLVETLPSPFCCR